MRFEGQTVFLTGAGAGIGRATAERCAAEGATVVATDIDREGGEETVENIEAAGGEARFEELDVRDADRFHELVENTAEEHGLDALVNNAGIVIHEAAETMTAAEWDSVLDVNLRGTFLCSKHVGREMMDSGGGSILSVSSMSAFVANYPQRQVAYNASKGGVESFTRQLASEWAEHGIRVNTIAPGYIRTDNTDQADAIDPDIDEIWKSEMLMDDIAGPEAVAPAALFLASDASRYVTGASIVVDGGYTVQ